MPSDRAWVHPLEAAPSRDLSSIQRTPTLLSYRPPLFPQSRRIRLYPGHQNEAVLEPLRFSVCDRRSNQKSGRCATGLLDLAQRNAAVCARQSLRQRNAKSLAVAPILGFHPIMSAANNSRSKLSALITRQRRKRQGVPSVDNLARWAEPPVASPLVPQAAADTLRVSGPSASPPAFPRAASFCRARSADAV
jgi:hypothetical protein